MFPDCVAILTDSLFHEDLVFPDLFGLLVFFRQHGNWDLVYLCSIIGFRVFDCSLTH